MVIEESIAIRALEQRKANKLGRNVAFPILATILIWTIFGSNSESPQSRLVEGLATLRRLEMAPGRRLSANTSDQQDLELVRGIGPVTARNLVQVREFLGPFQQLRHLRLVPGIGISRLEKIESQMAVGKK